MNGLGQTLASFVRALGPALGGLLWAWSLEFFPGWGHQFLPFVAVVLVVVGTDWLVYRSIEQRPLEEPVELGDPV